MPSRSPDAPPNEATPLLELLLGTFSDDTDYLFTKLMEHLSRPDNFRLGATGRFEVGIPRMGTTTFVHRKSIARLRRRVFQPASVLQDGWQEYQFWLGQLLHYGLHFCPTALDAQGLIATAIADGTVSPPEHLRELAQDLRMRQRANETIPIVPSKTELATAERSTKKRNGRSFRPAVAAIPSIQSQISEDANLSILKQGVGQPDNQCANLPHPSIFDVPSDSDIGMAPIHRKVRGATELHADLSDKIEDLYNEAENENFSEFEESPMSDTVGHHECKTTRSFTARQPVSRHHAGDSRSLSSLLGSVSDAGQITDDTAILKERTRDKLQQSRAKSHNQNQKAQGSQNVTSRQDPLRQALEHSPNRAKTQLGKASIGQVVSNDASTVESESLTLPVLVSTRPRPAQCLSKHHSPSRASRPAKRVKIYRLSTDDELITLPGTPIAYRTALENDVVSLSSDPGSESGSDYPSLDQMPSALPFGSRSTSLLNEGLMATSTSKNECFAQNLNFNVSLSAHPTPAVTLRETEENSSQPMKASSSAASTISLSQDPLNSAHHTNESLHVTFPAVFAEEKCTYGEKLSKDPKANEQQPRGRPTTTAQAAERQATNHHNADLVRSSSDFLSSVASRKHSSKELSTGIPLIPADKPTNCHGNRTPTFSHPASDLDRSNATGTQLGYEMHKTTYLSNPFQNWRPGTKRYESLEPHQEFKELWVVEEARSLPGHKDVVLPPPTVYKPPARGPNNPLDENMPLILHRKAKERQLKQLRKTRLPRGHLFEGLTPRMGRDGKISWDNPSPTPDREIGIERGRQLAKRSTRK